MEITYANPQSCYKMKVLWRIRCYLISSFRDQFLSGFLLITHWQLLLNLLILPTFVLLWFSFFLLSFIFFKIFIKSQREEDLTQNSSPAQSDVVLDPVL